MANAINPWLASYLVAIAEEYGANIPSIPSHQKQKKVQLTEWLTYATNNDDQLLWAKISDKELSIPIRFSKKAIAEYNRLNHKRITQHKTAIVSIKDFRPFFTRVPRGGNMKLTSQCVLAFDCDSISLVGSYDEAPFGSPREVETNDDLRLWSEGLRQDGGGGNVLKQCKDAKQATVVLDTVPQPILVPSPKNITIPPKQDNQIRNMKPHASISDTRRKTSNVDLLRRRERLFRRKPRGPPSSLDATALLMDEDEVPQKYQNGKESVTGDLCDEQREQIHVPKFPWEQRRSSTNSKSPRHSPKIQSRVSSPGIPITNWSPSPSPARRKPLSPLPSTNWAAPVSPTSFALSSHPTAPTPEQRPRNTTGALPPSSPPPESEIIAHETVLLPPPTILQPSHDKYPVIRKVPRPPQPVPVNESDFGPTQILVPNSDTSLSFSQSQPLSQSQSHSVQEVPESSQPVVLSQLSFSKPRKDIDATNPFVERASEPDVDDGRNTAAKGDPLFSGTLDEDAPYAGDQSSLDHAHEESPSQIHVNGDPTEEGITDASIIVQPTVTRRQAEDSHNQATAEAQHDTEPLSVKDDNRDGVTMEVIQDLDEDDAQIHYKLSGSSYSSPPRNSPQQHSPPREYVHAPSGGIGAHADADHSQSMLNSRSSTAFIRRSTPKGDVILNRTTGTSVGVVQHDGDAWSAPSFLRPSSSNNIRTHRSTPSSISADPHMLGKLKTAKRNPIDRRLKSSLIREAPLPRSRPQVDQNQAPGEAYVARQPKIPTQAQKKTPLAPVLTSLQSRPNKRSKDVISDADSTTELSRSHAKKRRLERTASKIAGVKPSVLNDGRGMKLKGYRMELSGFVLDEISQPLVSWLRVKDILLKTSRDREEDGI